MPCASNNEVVRLNPGQASCLFKVFSLLCVCFRTVKSQMGGITKSKQMARGRMAYLVPTAPWHLRISGGEVEGGFYFPFPISSCPFNVMKLLKANRMPAFGIIFIAVCSLSAND